MKFAITFVFAFLFVSMVNAAAQDPTSIKVPGAEETAMVVSWDDLLTGNTGTPVQNPTHKERIVQATGTFGGATVIMEGSNDGVNYVTLTDDAGTPAAISFTAAGLKKIRHTTRYIRPSVSGGAAAAIDIKLLLVK